MSDAVSSEQLLARVVQQDVAALGALYDRHAPGIYGLIAHILPTREDADEILQAVFTRLWKESARLCQSGGSVAVWLVVTARTSAVERRRDQHSNAAAANGPVPAASAVKGRGTAARGSQPMATATKSASGDAASTKPNPQMDGSAADRIPKACLPQPGEVSVIDSRLTLLHKAIHHLPKPQRQALELAVFGGLSEAEIAAALGEPLGKTQRSLRAAITFVKHRHRAVNGTWAANI